MFPYSWVGRLCSKELLTDWGNTSPCKGRDLVIRESSSSLDLDIILQWRQAFVGVSRFPRQGELRLQNSSDERVINRAF